MKMSSSAVVMREIRAVFCLLFVCLFVCFCGFYFYLHGGLDKICLFIVCGEVLCRK